MMGCGGGGGGVVGIGGIVMGVLIVFVYVFINFLKWFFIEDVGFCKM